MKKIITLLTALLLVSNVYGQTAKEYFNRGNAKYKLEDYRGAIADCTKAIELNPNEAGGYNNRGIAKIFFGQKDSGCLDLSIAGELGFAEAYEAIKKFCN